VDNPLALPLDPVLLGWMLERRAQALAKVVRTREPAERVGIFARDLRGRHRVVEYSELPEGGLPPDLNLGSIGLHAFSLRWLASAVAGGEAVLPLHRARKAVPHLGEDGRRAVPRDPNAWKVERFVFDLIPLAERSEFHEVAREREFAPLKNAEGPDSPPEVRRAVEAEVRRWYEERRRVPPEPPSLRPLEMTTGEP
jgi:UDP-N-acetylglucosamine/UDP-N-acetylgalactosamine diphosphorylase